jgi:hypothetical protein
LPQSKLRERTKKLTGVEIDQTFSLNSQSEIRNPK